MLPGLHLSTKSNGWITCEKDGEDIELPSYDNYKFGGNGNRMYIALEYCLHSPHSPPGTKFGLLLTTTDGKPVNETKRTIYEGIFNRRVKCVREITIPAEGDAIFTIDHCEYSNAHNNAFRYVAVQLDIHGDFDPHGVVYLSFPFWTHSRNKKRGKSYSKDTPPLKLIKPNWTDRPLQLDSVEHALLEFDRVSEKPMTPCEEYQLLKRMLLREKCVTSFIMVRCKNCKLQEDPFKNCSDCKNIPVVESNSSSSSQTIVPVGVEETGASDNQDFLEYLSDILSPLSSSSSSSQMSEHVDQRGEGLEETSGKDLTEVSKPVDVEEAGARPFSSASSLQMSEEDIDQTGRGPGNASRKRSYSEINQTEEAEAAVELEEIEELHQEEVLSGSGLFGDSNFLPNGDGLKEQIKHYVLKRCDECAAQSDPSYHCSEKCQRVEVSEQVGVEEDPAEYVEEAGEGLEETSRKRPHDEMADNEAKAELEKYEAFSKGEWKYLFPQCASSPTSGPSSASVPEGGNSTEGDRNGIGSPQSSSSKKYPSNVEGNFPAYHQNFSSEPADKEDLDSFALFPSL